MITDPQGKEIFDDELIENIRKSSSNNLEK